MMSAQAVGVRLHQSRLVDRMDPGYWHPRYAVLDKLFASGSARSVSIGELRPFMTYGAIASGGKPRAVKRGGVVRIDPKAFRAGGLDISSCIRLEKGSKWDVARARVRVGDVLFVRSGVASIGRAAVFDLDETAVVGCFVDIIRQDALCPYYVCAFLHSELGRLQIDRLKSGVGTVNLNFDEIKSLRVPLLAPDAQRKVSELWRSATHCVEPGQTRRTETDRVHAAALKPFDDILSQVGSV